MALRIVAAAFGGGSLRGWAAPPPVQAVGRAGWWQRGAGQRLTAANRGYSRSDQTTALPEDIGGVPRCPVGAEPSRADSALSRSAGEARRTGAQDAQHAATAGVGRVTRGVTV
jgi:hypothetical protein